MKTIIPPVSFLLSNILAIILSLGLFILPDENYWFNDQYFIESPYLRSMIEEYRFYIQHFAIVFFAMQIPSIYYLINKRKEPLSTARLFHSSEINLRTPEIDVKWQKMSNSISSFQVKRIFQNDKRIYFKPTIASLIFSVISIVVGIFVFMLMVSSDNFNMIRGEPTIIDTVSSKTFWICSIPLFGSIAGLFSLIKSFSPVVFDS